MNRNGTNFKQFNEGKMDYLVFDTLGSKKSQNKILTILKGEPYLLFVIEIYNTSHPLKWGALR